MNIKNYIAVDENEESLYAVLFEGSSLDALDELFERWTDASWLFDCFTTNWDAFSAYFKGIAKEEAVKRTLEGARYLFTRLSEYALRGATNQSESLSDLFLPLDASQDGISIFSRQKYKETHRRSANPAPWLRIYAIRLDHNLFVITGGGIKLTKRMQDCPRLDLELQKLNYCASELRSRGGPEGEEFQIYQLY